MNFNIKSEKDKRIRKEMKEMAKESERIINLLKRDDFPIELIKVRDFKKYFKKDKLPSINNSMMSAKKQKSYTSTLTIDRRNQYNYSTLPYQTYSTFYASSYMNSTFNQKMHNEEHSIKQKKIKELAPKVSEKIEKEYRTLPLFFKKLKKDYVYVNNQLVEDPMMSERYRKKNDIDICIDKGDKVVLAKPALFPPQKEIKKKSNYIPNLFRVQNFHLRKSLVLIKQEKKTHSKSTINAFHRNYNTINTQNTKPHLSIIEI